jgi:hypothetical protein
MLFVFINIAGVPRIVTSRPFVFINIAGATFIFHAASHYCDIRQESSALRHGIPHGADPLGVQYHLPEAGRLPI